MRTVPHTADYNDGDLYRFGLALGARTLSIAPIAALKRLILPLEYIRCAEMRYVLEHLDATMDHTILDIGSPKLLSLFLVARVGARVYATDLVDYFFRSYDAYARTLPLPLRDRYVKQVQDARKLEYSDGSFDRVFSISAIEHIPNWGDREAMLQIARVLRPGGRCVLTVPWSDRGYFEEVKPTGDPDVYWATSDADTVFFQRCYDAKTLGSRLLDRTGLELVDLTFWGERTVAVEDVLLNRRLPKVVRWMMLPGHFPLSRAFLTELRQDEPSRKKVACLTVRKAA